MDNMEKRVSKLKPLFIFFARRAAFFAALFILAGALYLNAQNVPSAELLRFPLWFPVDNVPALQKPLKKGDSIYTQAIEEIRALTPFMLEGLIYGWKFTYTPSDKLRGVDEYFSMEPLFPIESDERLSFTDARHMAESARLECWVEYRMSPDMIRRRESWQSVQYRKIRGEGEAPIMLGGEGIRESCRQALKEAVRAYARSFIKNKPKEIAGTVLLTDFPRYYIKSGKYRTDLDFFLFVSRIEEYTRF